MGPVELAGRLVLAIVVTLVATRSMAHLVQRARQPPVVGEIVAGLVLGPSVLGALPGDFSRTLFPAQITAVLTVLGEIGVVLYLFVVGLGLGVRGFGSGARSLAVISLSTLVVPFALGLLVAIKLYSAHDIVAGRHVDPLAFALFIGTAFAMTAFPVLARILTDSGLQREPVGDIAIRCAAILDMLGWMLLALALAVATSAGLESLLRLIVEGAAFVAFLLVAVRPVLGRIVARQPVNSRPRAPFLVLVVTMAFAAAAVTDALGLHPLLGAVLFGAVYPRRRNPECALALEAALAPLTRQAILPFFFLLPGLHVDLRHIGAAGIPELVLVVLVACVGKFGAAASASRACGHPWPDALVLGALMNTRGLIELVVLSAGLSAHVLDTKLYGVMVIMALTTTMMTMPLLNVLRSRTGARLSARAREEFGQHEQGQADAADGGRRTRPAAGFSAQLADHRGRTDRPVAE